MMVSTIRKRDVTVVKLRGSLDQKMAADIESKIFALVSRGALKFIFDMKHVKGILSRGVHMMVDIKTRIDEAGGSVKLANLGTQVKFVLEFAKVAGDFEIFPDQAEALKSYGIYPKVTPGGG